MRRINYSRNTLNDTQFVMVFKDFKIVKWELNKGDKGCTQSHIYMLDVVSYKESSYVCYILLNHFTNQFGTVISINVKDVRYVY